MSTPADGNADILIFNDNKYDKIGVGHILVNVNGTVIFITMYHIFENYNENGDKEKNLTWFFRWPGGNSGVYALTKTNTDDNNEQPINFDTTDTQFNFEFIKSDYDKDFVIFRIKHNLNTKPFCEENLLRFKFPRRYVGHNKFRLKIEIENTNSIIICACREKYIRIKERLANINRIENGKIYINRVFKEGDSGTCCLLPENYIENEIGAIPLNNTYTAVGIYEGENEGEGEILLYPDEVFKLPPSIPIIYDEMKIADRIHKLSDLENYDNYLIVNPEILKNIDTKGVKFTYKDINGNFHTFG